MAVGCSVTLPTELVEGQPLDQYLREQHPGLRERLRLLLQICAAVGHAHRRGVIHRDLKPANVLVTADAQIKILDFGIARATESDLRTTTLQTGMGQLVGTVPYMSPEQSAGHLDSIDTRSDVYSLGVMLYEMLTGHLPYDLEAATIPRALRTIQEATPTPPSRYDPQLRGDLTAILFRALEKEPARRYASADALAEDAQRFLDQRPVSATPPSFFYHISKLARRHRLPFALACSLLLLLAASAVTGTIMSINLVRQRDLARKAQQQEAEARVAAESAVAFLERLFERSDPWKGQNKELTVRDLVGDGVNRLQTELEDQPLSRARLQVTLGGVLTSLGDYDQAEALLVEARDTYAQQLGEKDLGVADACLALAELYSAWEKHDQGYQQGLQALSLRERRLDARDPKVIEAVKQLGANRYYARDREKALLHMRDALDRARITYGDGHEETISCINDLGATLVTMSDGDELMLAEAEELLQAALPIAQQSLGDHTHTAKIYDWLMRIRHARGDKEGARQFGRQGLAVIERALHPAHPEVLFWQQEVAYLLDDQEAIPILRRVLETRRKVFEPNHPSMANVLTRLGKRLLEVGELEESERLLAEALQIRRGVFGNAHLLTGLAAHELARARFRLERYAEAETLWLEAHEILKGQLPADDLRLITNSLVTLYDRLDRADEAERWKTPP